MRNWFPQFLVCPFLRSASGASARTYLTYDPVETKHPQAGESYHMIERPTSRIKDWIPVRYVVARGSRLGLDARLGILE